jgi:radical SAM-linked protein
MWERALRRARLPLAYSAGFSPRPKMSFGLALPTGSESVAEYLDFELEGPGAWPGAPGDSAEVARSLLGGLLPAGVAPLASAVVDPACPSLQEDVAVCRWELELGGVTPEELESKARSVLASTSLLVTRETKGEQKQVDIRPSVVELSVLEAGDGTKGAPLAAELATKPRGVRPAELLEGLGSDLELVASCRTHQWIERDGARREPLPLGATDAPHALERAS